MILVKTYYGVDDPFPSLKIIKAQTHQMQVNTHIGRFDQRQMRRN
jgi:hypothetical protein